MDRPTIDSYHDEMSTTGIPWVARAEEVVNMLDIVCLQPKVWNNPSKLLLMSNLKDTSQNDGVNIVFSRSAKFQPSEQCLSHSAKAQNNQQVLQSNSDLPNG